MPDGNKARVEAVFEFAFLGLRRPTYKHGRGIEYSHMFENVTSNGLVNVLNIILLLAIQL